MLAAGIGVVDREEVAFLQFLQRIHSSAGLEDVADRPKLHRDQLRLRHRVASRVQQCRGSIACLPQHGGKSRPHQLHAHLARRGNQRLADNRVIDRIECHCASLRRKMLPAASRDAFQPGGTQMVEL